MQIFLHFFTIRNKIPRLFTAYNHADSVYTLRSNSPEGKGRAEDTKHQIFRQNVKICKQISFFCSKICVFKFFVVLLQSVLSLWRLN